jgi:putative ABC transport system permease protein
VALSTSLPFGTGTGMSFTVEGRVSDPEAGAGRMRYVGATPDFFQAMGIPLRAGRLIEARDRTTAPLVAVINETAARRYWSNQDAIGQHITIGQPVNPEIADPMPREIVGVVADVHEMGMEVEAPPIVYVPLPQVPPALATLFARLLPLSLVIRTPDAPETFATSVRAAILRVDPMLPVTGTRTGNQLLSQSLQVQQFNALLMGALAVLAIVLAFSGIYGVVSCLAAQRTSEIGVRLALGATRADVLRLVITQGLVPTIAGVLAGIVATLASSRVLASLLFGVSANDPLAVSGSAAGVLILAIAAAYIPARRAARLDPVTSMRIDA